MPKTTTLTPTRYKELLSDLRGLIETGRQKAARAAGRELVETYWEVGKRIKAERLTSNAGYDQSILEDVAEELSVDYTTLTRSVRFFELYEVAPGGKNMTWSHYKLLIPLQEPQERRWYEHLAEEEGLKRSDLARAIKNKKYEAYLKAKGKSVHAPALERPAKPTYLYKALVERVVDGDTLILRIDLGFQVFKEQRIRLADIDAPSLDEPKGRQAFQYVRDQMAQANFVMVKTNKIDIHGRYVGNVFYSFKEKNKDMIFAKGRYLNQELVDKGLARVL